MVRRYLDIKMQDVLHIGGQLCEKGVEAPVLRHMREDQSPDRYRREDGSPGYRLRARLPPFRACTKQC
jgi:hypothetical protein